MTTPVFRKTLEYIDEALDNARLTKRQIDEVVLVGGSTRIPKVRSLIEDYFSGLLGTVSASEGIWTECVLLS